MEQSSLIIVLLAMLATGGVFYAVAYPYLSGDALASKRQAAFKNSAKRGADRGVDQNKRRQQILDSIKDVDGKAQKKKRTLEQKLLQANITWTPMQFYYGSAALGLAIGLLLFVLNGDPLVSVGGAAAGGFGIPNWIVSFLFKRRIKKFIEEFPNAVDVIIRGVKAGLPIGDCLRIIAGEAAEPVKTEFRRIVEAQSIGLSVGEAVERIQERMPIAEANFFSIVINLQQKSGGNLSEALGNLSRVLRDRAKMRLKIKAMSAEAKASAGIIGSLPFAVALLVWISSPDYISLLWTTVTGRIVMGFCAMWMGCGIFVMRRLINFDF